jgi:hypothetical protein
MQTILIDLINIQIILIDLINMRIILGSNSLAPSAILHYGGRAPVLNLI